LHHLRNDALPALVGRPSVELFRTAAVVRDAGRCHAIARHERSGFICAGRTSARARCLQFSRDPSVRHPGSGTSVEHFQRCQFDRRRDIARPDASYGIVIRNHVIEHVPDHRRALCELGRILSAHGFLFFPFRILHGAREPKIGAGPTRAATITFANSAPILPSC
jgi:hypothetical protein